MLSVGISEINNFQSWKQPCCVLRQFHRFWWPSNVSNINLAKEKTLKIPSWYGIFAILENLLSNRSNENWHLKIFLNKFKKLNVDAWKINHTNCLLLAKCTDYQLILAFLPIFKVIMSKSLLLFTAFGCPAKTICVFMYTRFSL